MDLSQFDEDEVLNYVKTESIQSFLTPFALLFGLVHNNGEHRENLDFVAAAAVLFGAVTGYGR